MVWWTFVFLGIRSDYRGSVDNQTYICVRLHAAAKYTSKEDLKETS